MFPIPDKDTHYIQFKIPKVYKISNNLEIRQGTLTTVSGPTGSGKTRILFSFVRKLFKENKNVKIHFMSDEINFFTFCGGLGLDNESNVDIRFSNKIPDKDFVWDSDTVYIMDFCKNLCFPSLKDIAMDNSCTVIASTQTNRKGVYKGEDVMIGFFDSNIVFCSDLIISCSISEVFDCRYIKANIQKSRAGESNGDFYVDIDNLEHFKFQKVKL